MARSAARIDGGWQEILDLLTDLGHPPDPMRTRAETAELLERHLPAMGALALAREADRAVFGPDDQPDSTAEEYWWRVRGSRRILTDSVPWHRRLLAAISPRSLCIRSRRRTQKRIRARTTAPTRTRPCDAPKRCAADTPRYATPHNPTPPHGEETSIDEGPSLMNQTRYCSTCGSLLSEEAVICGECGARYQPSPYERRATDAPGAWSQAPIPRSRVPGDRRRQEETSAIELITQESLDSKDSLDQRGSTLRHHAP